MTCSELPVFRLADPPLERDPEDRDARLRREARVRIGHAAPAQAVGQGRGQ